MISKEEIKLTDSTTYTFGEFRLETESLLLLRNSKVVPLAPKAVEVLFTLVEREGKLVTKQEILDKVWADTFVEEANLTHHISALRKALGEDKNRRKFIETIPRRGYRFVAPVTESKNGAVEVVFNERIAERLTEEFEIKTEEIERNDNLFPKLPTIEPANGWLTRNKLPVVAALLLAASFAWVFYGYVWRDGKIPGVIKQCEGGICGTWTRAGGNQFNAVWDNDARATLTVEQFDNNQVVFTRHDTGASVSRTLSARYVGMISGNKITDGKVTWTADGQSWSGSWSADW